MARLARGLFLATLVLLPLGLVPAAPALHPRVQWSDLLLAGALPLWLLTARPVPRPRAIHLLQALYLASAALAWWLAGTPRAGGVKLAGLVSLVAFAVLTSAQTRDGRGAALAGRAVAVAAALAALSALAGTALHLAGIPTPLVGPQGDFVPGDYPRARGVFTHPNGLASFCIAAAGVIASPRAALPRPVVRALLGLLVAAAVASLSRGVLGLVVALAVAGAASRAGRVRAAVAGVLALAAIVTLSVTYPRVDPTRPWDLTWSDAPSPRRQAFASAGRTLLEHPLGIGPGARPARVNGVPFEAHCTPLDVAATLGLPAAFALLGLPLVLWRRRGRPTDRAAWGALLGLGLDALAQDAADFRHLWLVLGWLDADREPARPPPPDDG